MKTYCKHLVITREMVGEALATWLRGRSGKKNGWRIEVEHGGTDQLVDEIHKQIRGRTLSFAPIRRYTRVEPTNGKVRVLGVESVKQQVCDYVAVMAIQPMLDAKLGYYQCAGVPGKGQHLCRSAIRRWSREGGYFVKADVRQCYPSCSPEVVMRLLERYVRSLDVLYLCEALLSTYDSGMEIGSYLSLCMLNLVLSFAYHHVEGLAKSRRGKSRRLVRHQVWHMDDVLLFGRDKRDLRVAMRSVDAYLRSEFGLQLKEWKVCKVTETERPDMGGWVACDGRITLRDGIFIRTMRALRDFRRHPSLVAARRICSYRGWVVHADLDRMRETRGFDHTCRIASKIVGRYDRMEVAV